MSSLTDQKEIAVRTQAKPTGGVAQMRDREPMGIYDRLSIPAVLTAAGIDDAFLRSTNMILLADMSRFDFANCAYHGADLSALPLGHLLDHRVRGTLLPPVVHTPNLTIGEEEWRAAAPAIEEWLWHMLSAGNQPGARALVAEALKLDPSIDACQLASLGILDRSLFRHCVRGRLGSAVSRVVALELPHAERADVLALIARLLIYLACFSTQIIAARAWWIDHLPFRTDKGRGPYRDAAFWRDIHSTAETINQIGAYVADNRPRYPNGGPVTSLKSQAHSWRRAYEQNDDELRETLRLFYIRIKPVVRKLRKAAKAARRRVADKKNFTAHRALFGVTAGDALAFAATRLVQLRDCSDDLVGQAAVGGNTILAAQRESLPRLNNPDVASILYVLRITLLKDSAASLSKRAGVARELVDQTANLRELRFQHMAGGTEPGQDLINIASKRFFKGRLAREPLSRGLLAGGQLFDVLPEFWLQTVGPAPRMQMTSLELKTHADEQKRKHRPPNVRRASGKGGKRHRPDAARGR